MMNAFGSSKEISTKDLSTYAYIFRNYSKKSILHNAAKPVAQCTICDMVGCKSPCSCKEKWILCEGRSCWSHFLCVNLTKGPEGDYVFPICFAQYERTFSVIIVSL